MSNRRVPSDFYIEREGAVEEFERFLSSDAVHILNIFTNGDGGIGKTRLLLKFQQYCSENPEKVVTAKRLVDFYNTESHTKLGIMRQIADSVGRDHLPAFKESLEEYEKTSDASILPRVENTFRESYRAFSERQQQENKRVVLFFDTYEVIQKVDEEASASGTELSLWIETKLFPELAGNTKFVVSGRYALTDITQTGLSVQPLELPHFSLAETSDFLKTWFEEDEEALIKKFGSEERINTFHALANGRPILLALLVDNINYERKPLSPDKFLYDIEKQTGKIGEAITEKQKEIFEKALIYRIADISTPEDRTVTLMAIAYRRMTAGLLSFLIGQPIEKAQAQEVLETLKSFSFIKPKEAEAVYLLHDEVRRMIVDLWWDKHDPERTVRQDIAKKIVKYYDEKLLGQARLSDAEREIYSAEAIEYEFLANAKENPKKALERFSEEFDIALQDGHYDLCEMLLRIARGFYQDLGFPQQHHIDWRQLDYYRQTHQRKPEEIFEQAKAILAQNENKPEWQRSELPAHLLYVCGAAAAEPNDAIDLLKKASVMFCKGSIDYWMYRTDNLLGYRYYRQGKFSEAIKLLERARKGFYRLLIYGQPPKSEVRQLLYGFLLSMGNLAAVYSYTGELDRAIRKAELTLTLLRRLPRNQLEIARSNATVGHISLLLGDRVNAKRHLTEAEELLKKIQNRLLEGRIKPDLAFLQYRVDRFAYLLEYYRVEELAWLKKHRISHKEIEQLQEARKLVEAAISILEKEPPIPKELADAYYVLGELYMATPGQEYWQKAEKALENALKWGQKSGFLYRVVDTLESLVTLYYFWNGESDIRPELRKQNAQRKKRYQDELERIDLSVYPELAGKLTITQGDEQFDIALGLLRKKDSGLLGEARQILEKAFEQYVLAVHWMKSVNENRHHLASRVFYDRLKILADEEREGEIIPISEHLERLRPLLWRKKGSKLDSIYKAVMIRLLPKDEQIQRLSGLREQIQESVNQWDIGPASLFNACLIEVYRRLSPKGNESDEYLEQFLLQLILQAAYHRIRNDEYQFHRSIEIVRKELPSLQDQHLQKAIEGYADCREGALAYRPGEYGRFLDIFLQDDLDIGRRRFDQTFPGARTWSFKLLQRGEKKLQEAVAHWENMLTETVEDEQKQSLQKRIKRYRQYLGETRFRFGELLMLNGWFEDDVYETPKKQKGALSYLKMAIEDTRLGEDWYRYDDSVQSYVNALYFSNLYDDKSYSQEYQDYIDELEKEQRYPSVRGRLRIMQGDVLFSQYFQQVDEPGMEGSYYYVVKGEQKNKSLEERQDILRAMWTYYVEACNFMIKHSYSSFSVAVAVLHRRIQLIQDHEALEMIRNGLQSLWERQPYLEEREEELYTLVQLAEIRRLILVQ